jgi:Uma2 family endonuclease
MPAAAPTQISLEEYLHSSYRPDCDFVDGQIEERNLGEREHSILQVALGAWFFNRRVEWQIVVMSEQRTRVSPSRIRLPDVCIALSDSPIEKVVETPPLIAIEILSREDRINRVLVRFNDFLHMGVANIWLLDPIERTAFTYTASGLMLVESSRVTVSGSPIYLDLPEIFAALD